MFVIKASGGKEKYQPKKIINTCLRAGADKKLAQEVVNRLEPFIYEGISTKEILRFVHQFLKKRKPVAVRYNLKKAIIKLGPAGFTFEKLVSRILEEYGYKTKMPPPLSGLCITHEVDVVAEKDNLRYNIECKYHNSQGIYTGVKDVLYVWARYLDLKDGYKLGKCERFDSPWLFSNTKFSKQVIQFSKCKKIPITGWNYPQGESLRDLLEKKKLYPITILKSLDKKTREKLSKTDLIFVQDLIERDFKQLRNLTKIRVKKLNSLIQEAKSIL